MSKLFEAIKKARKDGTSLPTVVETASEDDSRAADAGARLQLESTAPSKDIPVPVEPRAERAARAERSERSERSVPAVPDRHGAPEEHMVSLTDPHSFEAEQFRALRHIVEERHRTDGLRALAVTSASEGDGKSLVSVNLAGALAQNKASRVLLVDADLRAPAIHHALGLRGSAAGLADVVSSATLRLDDVVVERSTYNLTVLTSGRTPSSPYEVLKSERFSALLDEARGRFDFIIVDTPPVLTFPDTRIVERLVDGVILVVGAHRTPRKLVDEAVDSIQENKLLGLVFNGEDEPKRYTASTYYGRGHGRGRGSAGPGAASTTSTSTRRNFWGKRRR